MSGRKPGPPATVVHRYSQSITDAELLRLLKARQAQEGGSFAATVERVLREALKPNNRSEPSAQEELPLGRNDEMVAA
ncbi:hypothetical protein [Nonomuraea sp. SYSU D8015]|uniref:hypothetical protein n=1 Tax=Nonomuraea sp. SYSU D8015 TaxID=2593644 RepID=UPI0016616679|nr:hypothetical protein [Nonomuraea sp. SYSU D8015]